MSQGVLIKAQICDNANLQQSMAPGRSAIQQFQMKMIQNFIESKIVLGKQKVKG